jgi:alpha-galactosidase
MGTIVMITADPHHRKTDGYSRCLSSAGSVAPCAGTAGESWTVTPAGALRSSGGQCLAVASGKTQFEACRSVPSEHWRYTLMGNLINDDACLSAMGPETGPQTLGIQPCGHNQANQIWSLPN